MDDPSNPLSPPLYDVVWTVVTVVMFVLALSALVSIGRSRRSLTTGQTLVWVLVTMFMPAVGPAAWFLVGRRPIPIPIPDAVGGP